MRRFLRWSSIVLCVAIILYAAVSVYAALTQTGSEVDAWAAVAEDTVREGAAVTISDSYTTLLYIDVAVSGTDAGEGVQIRVQGSPSTTGDDAWYDITQFVTCVGTADSEAITDNPLAAGSSTAAVADTDAGTWETEGTRWIFILDGVDVTKSELMLLVSYSNDASVTWQDVTADAHAQNTLMYDIASRTIVRVPFGVVRARVIYDNTYDGDGTAPQVHTHCHAVEVTAIQ